MSEHHHSHSHSHSHDHSHGDGGEMSFADRMERLLDHWLGHNADHADTYRQWAEKARENGLAAAAEQLEEAADMTLAINGKFKAAARLIR
ncbi:MAG: hypothetical protein ACLFRG_00565 [Desulfococcaceae bacterium]